MTYISEVRRKDNDIDILFGYTEDHYIHFAPHTNIKVNMIHVWFAYSSFNGKSYKDQRFDPGSKDSLWVITKNSIHKDFHKALIYFLRKLFK